MQGITNELPDDIFNTLLRSKAAGQLKDIIRVNAGQVNNNTNTFLSVTNLNSTTVNNVLSTYVTNIVNNVIGAGDNLQWEQFLSYFGTNDNPSGIYPVATGMFNGWSPWPVAGALFYDWFVGLGSGNYIGVFVNAFVLGDQPFVSVDGGGAVTFTNQVGDVNDTVFSFRFSIATGGVHTIRTFFSPTLADAKFGGLIIVRLSGNNASIGGTSDALPYIYDLLPFCVPISGSTWVNTINTNCIYNAYAQSGGSVGNSYAWDVVLGAGSWAFKVMYTSGPNNGQFGVYINDLPTGIIIDTYSAGVVYNVGMNATASLPASAVGSKVRIALKTIGKQVASGGYLIQLQMVKLVRTSNVGSLVDMTSANTPWLVDLYPFFSGITTPFQVSQPANISGALTNASSVLTGGLDSPGAQNSELVFQPYMGQGQWTLEVIHNTGPTRGIYSITLNGITIGSIDGYSAGNVYNVSTVLTGINSDTDGRKTLAVKTATKNASSSGYSVSLVHIQLRRLSSSGTGATGLTGLQGLPGIDGQDGEEGPPGPPGIQGIQGIQGIMGFMGLDGNDGEDGVFIFIP